MEVRKKEMGYVAKPYLVKMKFYNEQSFRNMAFFEDAASAIRKYDQLRGTSGRDWVQVVDLRSGQVIANNRAK